MPPKIKTSARNKPKYRPFIVLTHLPQRLPWYCFAGVFRTLGPHSLRRFEILRDVTKRGTLEGEFFLLVDAPGSEARKAADLMVTHHNARQRTVPYEEGMALSNQYRVRLEDLRAGFDGLLDTNTSATGPPCTRPPTDELDNAPHASASPLPAQQSRAAVCDEEMVFSSDSDSNDAASDATTHVSDSDVPSPLRRTQRRNASRDFSQVIELASSDDGHKHFSEDSDASLFTDDECSDGSTGSVRDLAVSDGHDSDCNDGDDMAPYSAHPAFSTNRRVPHPRQHFDHADDSYGEEQSDIPVDSSDDEATPPYADPPRADSDASSVRPVASAHGRSATHNLATVVVGEPAPNALDEDGLLLAEHVPVTRLPVGPLASSATTERLPLFVQQAAYEGSPFHRKQTSTDPPTFIQTGVNQRSSYNTASVLASAAVCTPQIVHNLTNEVFAEVWSRAEDQVSGASRWYPSVARTWNHDKHLSDEHHAFLAHRPETKGFVYNYQRSQGLTDDFCEWFGIQPMHASALLDLINAPAMQAAHMIKPDNATRTTYAGAFGDGTDLWDIAAEVALMILDAIRFGSEDYDPDTFVTLQEYRWKEWCYLLAQSLSERANLCVSPQRIYLRTAEYVQRQNREEVTRLFSYFTGRGVSKVIATERAAAGSRFVGGALEADLAETDCFVRPLGILPSDEDKPPSPDLRYSPWAQCTNLDSVGDRKASKVLQCGTAALPGCRIRLRGGLPVHSVEVADLEKILPTVVRAMTPGLPARCTTAFSRVCIVKAQLRRIVSAATSDISGIEMEFWFGDRGQAGVATFTSCFWVPLLGLQEPTSVELKDNCNFAHPLSRLRTRASAKYMDWYTQGALGSKGPAALPACVRPLRIDRDEDMTDFLVAYNSPLEAVRMLGAKVRIKDNTKNRDTPVRAGAQVPYLSSCRPRICIQCGLLGHEQAHCTSLEVRRLDECAICSAWGTNSSHRHDEVKCPIRKSYAEATRSIIERLLVDWKRGTIFGPQHEAFLRRMFATHGTDRRVYTRVPPTAANQKAFAARARRRMTESESSSIQPKSMLAIAHELAVSKGKGNQKQADPKGKGKGKQQPVDLNGKGKHRQADPTPDAYTPYASETEVDADMEAALIASLDTFEAEAAEFVDPSLPGPSRSRRTLGISRQVPHTTTDDASSSTLKRQRLSGGAAASAKRQQRSSRF